VNGYSSPPRAALDVGSNTIRLLVAHTVGNAVEVVMEDSRFVRLGSGVDKTGHLDADRKRAGIAAIAELRERAREFGVDELSAVATSAIRDAADGRAYVAEILDSTGVNIRIVDGIEEARLTFMGATVGLDIHGRSLVVDMGGGSAEFIHARDHEIQWEVSLRLGSGRLAEQFDRHDPPTQGEQEATRAYVQQMLDEHLPVPDAQLSIFTGGTASHIVYLTGIKQPITELAEGQIGEAERLAHSMPAADLARTFSLRPERAAILAPGITALHTIAEWSTAQHIWVSRGGLREGIILAQTGD
jgi:exopolyphosphatase/guanosine-5'-triphosphate,3'-diphosphate pyrophosphatase